jgi:DNA-binding CsgD family transcriptional regulator
MRERQKSRQHHEKVAREHEAAGDAAMAQFAYVAACAKFELALAEFSVGLGEDRHLAENEVRLCEKIGFTLFHGARPELATPWFERSLERCLASESLLEKALAAMLLLPRQYWLEARSADAHSLAVRMREFAATSKDLVLARRANLVASSYLDGYEAGKLLASSNEPVDEEPRNRLELFRLRAIVSAQEGRAEQAFMEFDRAIDVAKQFDDGYSTTLNWDGYAEWATALGRIDIARACLERALLVARERRIIWRIPYLTLRFAHALIIQGDYDHAHSLVSDAFTYDLKTPILRVLMATVGVELAHAIGDTELLKRSLDEEALEFAFRTGEERYIGPIVAANVKVMITQHQLRQAKTLIRRTLQALPIGPGNKAGDIFALAGCYGSAPDAARACELLTTRMRLPHHHVIKANLALWHAYDALRRRAEDEVKEYARKAAGLFERLGWKHQQAEALALAGVSRPSDDVREVLTSDAVFKPLAGIHTALTVRERQVAELALRGFTNRAIAMQLEISEHTVESHMSAIMGRLGVRSRHQLRESLLD